MDAHSHPASSSLYWERAGSAEAPPVVLVHAVGLDHTYWDEQVAALRPSYHVLTLDLPGHGRSAGKAGDWSFEFAAACIAQLLSALDLGPVHLVGISFGSMIAQVFALQYPELLRSLTLIGSACTFSDAARQGMRTRAATARAEGMQALVQSSLERWFTPETRRGRPDLIARVTGTLLADDPEIHAAIWEIIANFHTCDRLDELHCPTLVLVGEHDPSTTPEAAKVLAGHLRHVQRVVLPETSHMANLESAAALNAALLAFLSTLDTAHNSFIPSS